MPVETRPGQERFVAPLEETPLQAVDVVAASGAPRTAWKDAWDAMRRRPMFWISAALILVIVFVALFPGLLTAESPLAAGCQLVNSNLGPASGHPFGFTRQGCDVFARTVYGARASLSVGILAALIVAVLGIVVGALSGFFGGWLDAVLSRVGDIFFAIPVILGSIVLMSALPERTPLLVASAIALFAWPQVARIMRGSVLSARQSDYVTASVAIGLSRPRILVRHVLPNAIGPVIAVVTVALGTYIVAESTLSFLGIGLPTSTLSWGNDISQARTSIVTNPMPLVYPAAALSVTVLSFLMLGDVVRDALDPKERGRR